MQTLSFPYNLYWERAEVYGKELKDIACYLVTTAEKRKYGRLHPDKAYDYLLKKGWVAEITTALNTGLYQQAVSLGMITIKDVKKLLQDTKIKVTAEFK